MHECTSAVLRYPSDDLTNDRAVEEASGRDPTDLLASTMVANIIPSAH